jgi:hypothetical protein
MRARDIILGAPKRQPCHVTAIDGATRLDFALTLLSSEASTKIAEGAREYAKARGVADPKPEDVLFLRGKWAHTILLAAVDPDSPLDSPEPYFDNVARIERMLDDAAQVHVVQEQKDFQDEHAPAGEGCTPEQFVLLQTACIDEFKKGGDPERPFVGLRPAVMRSFATQSVVQSYQWTELVSQLGSQRSDSSPSSATSAPTSENAG